MRKNYEPAVVEPVDEYNSLVYVKFVMFTCAKILMNNIVVFQYYSIFIFLCINIFY